MSRAYYNSVLSSNEEKQARKINRRNIRDSCNPFELPSNEFRRIYRVNKDMALYLCDELSVDLQPINAIDGLPAYLKILTSLHLLADGSYQRPVGQDHGLCVSQTTVSKYLDQFVSSVYNRLLTKWISFPGNEEMRREVALGFSRKYGISHVLGVIDCTHVPIFPPPHPQGIQYLNRKGRHSLYIQLIADVNCKLLSINARFPGRVHDQFIFNNSVIKEEMRRLHNHRIGEYFLLGDSGYALEPWLMTPILHATDNTPESRYTEWHCKVRNIIERTNGYLKGIFRCLRHDRVLHYSPEKASKIVYACCILYNIMQHYRISMDEYWDAENTEFENLENLSFDYSQELRIAEDKRNRIIETYFS